MSSLSQSEKTAYRLYDFRRPDKLSKDQLRSLRTNVGRFTRSASNYLAALTRTSVDAKLLDVDQTVYGELFGSHDEPTLFSLFRLNGKIPGIMKFHLCQLYAALDRVMGGPGSGSVLSRPLTDFERSLMGDICHQLITLWTAEFRSEEFQVEIEMLETDERMIPRSLANDEFMIRAVYDLRLGPSNGQISVYMPLKELVRMIGQVHQSDAVDSDAVLSKPLPTTIKTLPLPITVDLGATWMNAKELAELRAGDVIKLGQEESEPLSVLVGGVPRFVGRPGILGRKMAIQIEGRCIN